MAKVSGQRKIYELINNRIIGLLGKGEIPWREPWVSGEPVNYVTKRPYRGINPFILISSGFLCPYWVSFKQAMKKLGGYLGEKEKGAEQSVYCLSTPFSKLVVQAFSFVTVLIVDACLIWITFNSYLIVFLPVS